MKLILNIALYLQTFAVNAFILAPTQTGVPAQLKFSFDKGSRNFLFVFNDRAIKGGGDVKGRPLKKNFI